MTNTVEPPAESSGTLLGAASGKEKGRRKDSTGTTDTADSAKETSSRSKDDEGGEDLHDAGGARVIAGGQADKDDGEFEVDLLESFMSEIDGMPRVAAVPRSSGMLLSAEETEIEKQKQLLSSFKISDLKVDWGSGDEEVERILGGRYTANHFDVFRLPPYCDEELIKKHFKKLSVLIHPDKCKHPEAAEAFFIIKQAYEELLKPEYRAKYASVIEEAKDQVVQERIRENKMRKKRGEKPLPTDDASIRMATIAKCEEIVKDREERLEYAETTKKENELRQQRMEAEAQAEEYRRQLEKEKWAQRREQRVDSWRDFRDQVVTKRPRVEEPEDYRKGWR